MRVGKEERVPEADGLFSQRDHHRHRGGILRSLRLGDAADVLRDRQAQVDFDAPDADRFPRFGEARGFEATLEPGELLYIPQYWFHHVENVDDACVSLNFWFRHQSVPSAISLPLSADQHLAMRRNVERHVADKLGARRAQADLPLISRAQPPAELAALRAEVCKLLAHVMGSREEVDAWLSELVAGRFELGHELGAADADVAAPAVEVV